MTAFLLRNTYTWYVVGRRSVPSPHRWYGLRAPYVKTKQSARIGDHVEETMGLAHKHAHTHKHTHTHTHGARNEQKKHAPSQMSHEEFTKTQTHSTHTHSERIELENYLAPR